MPDNYKGEKMLKRAEELNTSWAYQKVDHSKKDSGLVLLDNVQFIYELALAQLELEAFDVDYQVTNGLREFRLLETKELETLLKRLAYFKMVQGKSTDYFSIIQRNQTRSVNQYLTHWIYPYKGKFHPQMIRALMNFIGREQGDIVLDPFIVNGTGAIEVLMPGITSIGEHYETS